MIFSFLRRDRRAQAIEPLYGAIMAAALDSVLFAEMAVPDTFEGRFESVALHASLVLHRLKALPPPSDDIAQDLVNRIFDGLDGAMRESGVGDLGVPKRMKKFAAGFYGRLNAYSAALDSPDDVDMFSGALSRNLLDGRSVSAALVAEIQCRARVVADKDLAMLLTGDNPFVTKA